MAIELALQQLSQDIRDLHLGTKIPIVAWPISPLEFYRQYVATNQPVIITGALQDCNALHWTLDTLQKLLGSQLVPVACTPNGLADAVTRLPHTIESPGDSATDSRCFALPYETSLPFSELVENIIGRHKAGECVMYHQPQNDSVRTLYPHLLQDLQGSLWTWAQQVFGSELEAVNLWVGDDRSVTSFHKDHMENLYLVLQGEKHFTLLPPCDLHRMDVRALPVARWTVAGPPEGVPQGAPGPSTWPLNGTNPSQLQQSAALHTETLQRLENAQQQPTQHQAASAKQLAELHLESAQKQQSLPPLTLQLVQPPQKVLWSCKTPEDLLANTALISQNSAAAVNNQNGAAGVAKQAGAGLGAFQCNVKAGEVLYLPAMWWHHVRQSGQVVAANMWFDMQFDGRFAHFSLVETLSQQAGLLDKLDA